MQSLHLLPAAPWWAASSQNMSEFLVFDDAGAEMSNSGLSWQMEAHGEFGVTCNDEARCVSESRARSARAILGGAMM